jgi:arginyl-tRNA synthetase
VVVLSGKAARALGLDTEEVTDSQIYLMSGRRGIGVKADRLIDEMTALLARQTTDAEVAKSLASAAIRYYMARSGLNSVIVFDFDEALRTTGDSGVYIEYAFARSCSLLANAYSLYQGDVMAIVNRSDVPLPERVTPTEEALVLKIAQFPAVLARSSEQLSPAVLARYAFELATAFTDFYERPDPEPGPRVPFVRIPDRTLRTYRLALVAAFRQTLSNALNVLGMEPLNRI